MRVNTVLAPALQAMHTDKSCVSLFVPDHKTKLEFITFDCTATRRNSASNAPPRKRPTVRLKRAGRLSTEVSWHRNIGRKRHQRLRGLEGCLLPVATANALGMALVALLTTSSSGPAACEQLARKALERVVEGGGGGGGPRQGPKPRLPTRKRANLIGLAC